MSLSILHELFLVLRGLVPAPVRYFLTLVFFWPTVLKMRIEAYLFGVKRVYDRVPGTPLVIGQVPILQADVEALYELGVRSVVNLCAEWNGNEALYAQMGIVKLYLPTIDFDAPTNDDMQRAAAFIAQRTRDLPGSLVYVHCKAGRGRSVCVALAYLMLQEGLSADVAHERIASARPHVNDKRRFVTELRRGVAARELFSAALARQASPGRPGSGGAGNGAGAQADPEAGSDATLLSAAAAAASAAAAAAAAAAAEAAADSEVAGLLPRPGGGRSGSATRRNAAR